MNARRRMRPLLGTFVEIGVVANTDGADRCIDRAFDAVALIQQLMSFHDADSELSRLNHFVGEEVALHPHTAKVLAGALQMGRDSDQLFNCTVGGALVKQGLLPDHGDRDLLDCGRSSDIQLAGCRAKLLRPLRVTLDGIAKGYAVDCAVRALQQCGVHGGWVNAGGDLRVFGDMALSICRRELSGSLTAVGQLRNGAMATSTVHPEPQEDYPGWLVASACGAPAPGSWSVLAPSAWMADALTKVAGLAEGAGRAQAVARLGGQLVMAP